MARATGEGPVEALCLSALSPYAGQYTTGVFGCDSWRSGHRGAVDDPDWGEEAMRLYDAEEKAKMMRQNGVKRHISDD